MNTIFRFPKLFEPLHFMIMADDMQAPATKQDLQDFMRSLQLTFTDIDARFENIDKRFEKIDARFEQMEKRMDKHAEDMKHHFDITVEHIKHEMLHGALNDKVEQHEDRIQIIEQHVGLVAA